MERFDKFVLTGLIALLSFQSYTNFSEKKFYVEKTLEIQELVHEPEKIDTKSVKDFYSLGGDVSLLENALELESRHGRVFESMSDLSILLRHSNPQTVKDMLNVKNDGDLAPFSNYVQYLSFLYFGGSPKLLDELISLKDDYSYPFIQSSYILDYVKLRSSADDAKKLWDLESSNGIKIFCDGGDIVSFLKQNNSITDVEKNLEAYVNSVHGDSFSQEDLQSLLYFDIDPSYVEKIGESIDEYWAKDVKSLIRVNKLNVSIDEILGTNNTSKPDALIIFPTADGPAFYNNKLSAFYVESSKKLLEILRKGDPKEGCNLLNLDQSYCGYDLTFRVADDEHEMYSYLDNLVSEDTKLIIIGGHGSSFSLSFGDIDFRLSYAGTPSQKKYFEEKMYDCSDGDELSNHMEHIPDDAVIFHLSCENAMYGQMGLAGLTANITGNKVIAASKSFYVSDVEVNTVYPFDVTIYDREPIPKKIPDSSYNLLNKYQTPNYTLKDITVRFNSSTKDSIEP